MRKSLFIIAFMLQYCFAASVCAQESSTEMIPITVGGEQREYLLHIPASVQDNAPLMMSLHGNNNDCYGNRDYTRFDEVSDANGFIMAYPNARNNSWQVPNDTNTELAFLSAVIDDIHKRCNIDLNRVYLAGHSWGGVLACYAMNSLSNRIAAFVLSSAHTYNLVRPSSKRAVPFIRINGTSDIIMSYTLAEQETKRWVQYDGCNSTATVTENYPGNNPESPVVRYSYTGGRDGVEIVLLKIQNGGHEWYGNESVMHTATEAWEFCRQFDLNGLITSVDAVATTPAAPSNAYTITGVVAPENYKGIIIKDGKKQVVR